MPFTQLGAAQPAVALLCATLAIGCGSPEADPPATDSQREIRVALLNFRELRAE